MTLVPPPNSHGFPLPPPPMNPASLRDITNAKAYVDTLSSVRHAYDPPVNDDEIGAAESYKAAVVFSHTPGSNVAPLWLTTMNTRVEQLVDATANINITLQALRNTVDDMKNTMDDKLQVLEDNHQANHQAMDKKMRALENNMDQKLRELPVVVYNISAGPTGQLRSPMFHNGWFQDLEPPNPRTRNELYTFTKQQCLDCSRNLNLPLLPAGASIVDKRQQIALRLGIPLIDRYTNKVP